METSTPTTGLRVAVLVKQVPNAEELRMADGRLVREGVELEVNAYCRRANAKAVELAGSDGEVVVFTMGPPSADDALREMLACGATRGVHLCDPDFAGSDTLATARALALAITRQGPFDLVLCGLNAIDADTGQVGPEVAQLLGWPFAAGVRALDLDGRHFVAELETDDGRRVVEGHLPAVLSTAERLCDPSKAPSAERSAIDAARIVTMRRHDLGLRSDEVGLRGSPTSVGVVRTHDTVRRGWVTASVADALTSVIGLLTEGHDSRVLQPVPATGGNGPSVWCFLEDSARAPGSPLLGEAAHLAAVVGGTVTAFVPGPAPAGLGRSGADEVVEIIGGAEPEQIAAVLAASARQRQPWAVLFDATRTGRAIAAVVAASHGWGLTGDAIELEVDPAGRLVAWKPAFGGRLVAAIESRSPVQLVTVRPGTVPHRLPRNRTDPVATELAVTGPAKIVTRDRIVDDFDVATLLEAPAVVGVGTGVEPSDYPLLEPLRLALGGAPLAATRRVTDKGWLPRSRQIGITGHAIAPRLYIAVGISGKLNHMIGVRSAGAVVAVNADPSAPVFELSDVGIVGDWREIVDEMAGGLATVVESALAEAPAKRKVAS